MGPPCVLERRYGAALRAGSPSRQVTFEYAWGLVRSRYGGDVAKGVALLEELLPQGTEEQRDYVYYLGLGHYRLKHYERSLQFLDGLLRAEPTNGQGLRLRRRVRSSMRREGLLGMALVGGVALGIAGLVGVAIAKAKS
ncbi:LOW QUALITY PROTEIN: mitochondrial fission 1 protein [Eudromia elegans]